MEFKIIEKTKQKKVKEGYYLFISTSFGDGDYDCEFTIGPFFKGQENYLEEIINLLDELKNVDEDELYNNDAYQLWFNENPRDENDPRVKIAFGQIEWKGPGSISSWPSIEGTPYNCDYCTVHYINADGKKLDVEIIK